MWTPTRIQRVFAEYETYTAPLRVETDCGTAFVKHPANPTGEHGLACEFIGTRAAAWLQLPTFEWTVFAVDQTFSIPEREPKAIRGHVFCTKELDGHTWGGDVTDLAALENPEAIVGLVVVDT